jgi:hypothetical protein
MFSRMSGLIRSAFAISSHGSYQYVGNFAVLGRHATTRQCLSGLTVELLIKESKRMISCVGRLVIS